VKWLIAALAATASGWAFALDAPSLSDPLTLDSTEDQSAADTPLNGGNPSACALASTGTYASGRSYNVVIASPADGKHLSFNVFEPNTVDCARKHAIVLQASGLGGVKFALTDRFEFRPLLDRGIAAISFDQRGHGSSTGQKRFMDPNYEGRDVVAILDWAEANLNWLRRSNGHIVAGTMGASYGGGFQPTANAVDPYSRIAAMFIMSTWHSLPNLLSSNGVVNHAAVGLVDALGTVSQQGIATVVRLANGKPNDQHGTGWHPSMQTMLARLASETRIDADSRSMLVRRSGSDFCGEETPGTSLIEGLYGLPQAGSPSYHGAIKGVPTLVGGAPQDGMFNLQDMASIYGCMRKRGAPAYYVGAWFAHYPLLAAAQAANTKDLLAVGNWDYPAAGCGPLGADAFALFFDEYLNGRAGTFSGKWGGRSVCIPASNDPTHYYIGNAVPVGSGKYPIRSTAFPAGVQAYYLRTGPVVALPIARSSASFDLIGIPTIDLDIAPAPNATCVTCDPTLFVALGVRTADGTFQALGEKVTPLHEIGHQSLQLAGVAKSIAANQTLYLLIYNFSPLYGADAVASNLTTPLLSVQGTVALPIVNGTADPVTVIALCDSTQATTLWSANAQLIEAQAPSAYTTIYGMPAMNNAGNTVDGNTPVWGSAPAMQQQLRSAGVLAGGAYLDAACAAQPALAQQH